MSNNEQMQVKQKPKFSVAISTDTYKNLVNQTLGDPNRAKRFIASISSAVATNPALQACDAGTVLSGALLGESLNLSPSPQLGQYYLLPFKSKEKRDRNGNVTEPECTKAQFILGYKGYVQLALRSGQYKDLDVMEIKQGEYLGKDSDTGKPKFKFEEDDDKRDELPVIGYMARFEYLNGFCKTLYWGKTKMVKHADTYSPAFSADGYQKLLDGKVANNDLWKYSSFWYKDFDDMAKKTMLRQLISRWGIMSSEIIEAISKDNSFSEIVNGNEIVTTGEDVLLSQTVTETVEDALPNVETVDISSLK